MMLTRKILYSKFHRIIHAISALAICYILYRLLFSLAMPDCAFPSTLVSIPGLNGLAFSVTMKDCAFIGSSWEVEVRASRSGELIRTSILVYEPAFLPPDYAPGIPVISVADDGGVNISINNVDAVLFQKERLGNRKIKYTIGYVNYSRPNITKSESPQNDP